ncbi:MAG: Glutamyl-tRNA reductase [Chromatiales bacterium USCg_Taylor]|nr:MAG: Glutamyl-tRNA reductase [Chromatiales bacterium USCg_Taylor]
MPLLVVGINHKTAPIAVRERVMFTPDRLPHALSEFRRVEGVNEALILSTCNRTEIYCHQAHADTHSPLAWLTGYQGLDAAEIKRYLFSLPQEDAVRHLLRVACGLESMVLGEPQILGQIKNAYRAARRYQTLGKLLNRLFQHAFSVAKKVRTDTAIGSSPVSVAFAAVRLAQQIFGDFGARTALLIGAGDTIELTAQHLHDRGIRHMLIANRSLTRAQALAGRFGAYPVSLANLRHYLKDADIVLSATASAQPIVTKALVEEALQSRKHRLMFLADLAVPRDIEPEVATLPDAYLYTVDDLEVVIQDNLRLRQTAAAQADEIIATQVNRYLDWVQSLDAVASVRALRGKAETVREQVVQLARQRLESGADATAVIESLAHQLTNKLIHIPSVRMREASAAGRLEVLRAAQEIFDIGPPDESV